MNSESRNPISDFKCPIVAPYFVRATQKREIVESRPGRLLMIATWFDRTDPDQLSVRWTRLRLQD